jgi:hypothetical protein
MAGTCRFSVRTILFAGRWYPPPDYDAIADMIAHGARGILMRALFKALLRPLLCARCGRQLHECACDEVARQPL